jgi:hypothetical protein
MSSTSNIKSGKNHFVQQSGQPSKKRHRRSAQDIDRIYKCGWDGCDKAYGLVRNLNTHILVQGHGGTRSKAGKSHIIFQATEPDRVDHSTSPLTINHLQNIYQ